MLIYVFERTEDELKKLLIDGRGLQMGTTAGNDYLDKIKEERRIIMEEVRNANVDMNEDRFKTEGKAQSLHQSQ